MRISIDHAHALPLPGLASIGRVRVSGGVAEIAVRVADLEVMRGLPGRRCTIGGAAFVVTQARAEGEVMNLIARRDTNG